MSITPGPPPEPQPQVVEVAGTPRWITIAFVVVVAAVAALGYAAHSQKQTLEQSAQQARQENQILSAQIDKTNSRLADLKGELDVTAQKLGLTQDELVRAQQLATNLKKQQQSSDVALRQQMGKMQQDTSAKIGQVSTDLSGTKTEVEATKKDLEATKTQLQHAVGDLGIQSGLIAHNHDEVEELKRLGERNIYEFNLQKSKEQQRIGPIQVVLKKVDPKKYRYTMDVVADDKRIEKKDKTVGEPVQFIVHGSRAPYEIVVFNVTKDHATGYLSTPKDAAASSAPAPPSQ
jgi:chromosome segregation ATPase